ncbi:uncharacterized protein MELLADRAFT_117080 [Melampsora larici-populina 98AG31]|uniref:AAA protein C-terminal winged helix domain-containing protein n=1 Tax=Melampsora larici-populina (strain 98AG31 / pathotype 3-4-7) TaxID=747676 RepID=F4RT54_MELLP|nr:uncharacterized protein MELLADRAFT_117080 [Melampsora larici-populina 98AG31]EGG04445.1 hypothetical protein MELLADRAFT_117080 [Melampsora larici-populina 98AG31]
MQRLIGAAGLSSRHAQTRLVHDVSTLCGIRKQPLPGWQHQPIRMSTHQARWYNPSYSARQRASGDKSAEFDHRDSPEPSRLRDDLPPPHDSKDPASSWSDGVAAQAVVGSLATIVILGFGGYKYSVLQKMAVAFEPGYDPVLVLNDASKKLSNKPETARPTFQRAYGVDLDEEEQDKQVSWINRQEQPLIDQIVHGTLAGQYWLITGPKGTGKFSLIADAMVRNSADGVAVCECSDNLEIFRLRLGRCLNFEYSEDYIGGLFSRRDPREGGPLVDVERALNKLEKLSRYQSAAILHLQRNDDSYSLLLQLQQRAECWSQAGILTMIFTSDDHWPYSLLRKNASRMSVLTIKDLTKSETIRAVCVERKKLWNEDRREGDEEIEQVWKLVGGRIGHLSWCMKHKDMIHAANIIIEREKQWLLSRIGLIVDCDDDVMDEQKWSSSSFLLMQSLAKQAEEEHESGSDTDGSTFQKGLLYSEARQIMTRADFLDQLDHENMIAIDIDYRVRPNSVVMLNVIKEICNEPDFDEKLESVMERISAIESLGRTRELTWKTGKNGDGIMNIKLERN